MAEWEISGVRRPNYVGPSYRLKLIRALEHLAELYSATQGFAESSAYTVAFDPDPDTGEQVVKVQLHSQPPAGISILAADCVHNLRQSLDHLAYEVAIGISGSDPPPNEATSAYPIYDAPREGRELVLDDDRLSTKIGRAELIPDAIRAILEDSQPHYGGDRLKLALLRDLDDRAKHRALPVCVGIIRSGTATIDSGEIISVEAGPLEVGETEIARFRSTEPEVNVQGTFRIEVVFADGPGAGQTITEFVQGTRDFLRRKVVSPLEQLLYPEAVA